jgi:hypothetical protein
MTTGDIEKRTGVNRNQLFYWIRNGLILPKTKARKCGSKSEWGEDQIPLIEAIRDMERIGMHSAGVWHGVLVLESGQRSYSEGRVRISINLEDK